MYSKPSDGEPLPPTKAMIYIRGRVTTFCFQQISNHRACQRAPILIDAFKTGSNCLSSKLWQCVEINHKYVEINQHDGPYANCYCLVYTPVYRRVWDQCPSSHFEYLIFWLSPSMQRFPSPPRHFRCAIGRQAGDLAEIWRFYFKIFPPLTPQCRRERRERRTRNNMTKTRAYWWNYFAKNRINIALTAGQKVGLCVCVRVKYELKISMFRSVIQCFYSLRTEMGFVESWYFCVYHLCRHSSKFRRAYFQS